MLEVRDLSIGFRTAGGGHLAITRKLNFHIGAGERLGVVGESGCGKTVTGLSVLRLLPEAHARIDGQVLFARFVAATSR
jgi:peptide/nickel transport system ATP-binding protein